MLLNSVDKLTTITTSTTSGSVFVHTQNIKQFKKKVNTGPSIEHMNQNMPCFQKLTTHLLILFNQIQTLH